MPYYWTPGVVLDIGSSPGTSVQLETTQGNFEFYVRDIRLAEPMKFLDGDVVVERVPLAEKLTTESYEDDYADILAGQDGSVRVAWVAYKDSANVILSRRFDGTSWQVPETVTESPGDIHLVKMERSGDEAVWFV